LSTPAAGAHDVRRPPTSSRCARSPTRGALRPASREAVVDVEATAIGAAPAMGRSDRKRSNFDQILSVLITFDHSSEGCRRRLRRLTPEPRSNSARCARPFSGMEFALVSQRPGTRTTQPWGRVWTARWRGVPRTPSGGRRASSPAADAHGSSLSAGHGESRTRRGAPPTTPFPVRSRLDLPGGQPGEPRTTRSAATRCSTCSTDFSAPEPRPRSHCRRRDWEDPTERPAARRVPWNHSRCRTALTTTTT